MGEPSWRLYAAAVFNDHNPRWKATPDITKYLQRMSWLLRQGKPAKDVAIYLPTSAAYAGFTSGKNSVERAFEVILGEYLLWDYAAKGGAVPATKRGFSGAGDSAEAARLSNTLFDAKRSVLDETTLGARLDATFDPKTKFFPGQASYVINVELPTSLFGQGRRTYLDFGQDMPIEPLKMVNGMRAWLDSPVRESAYAEVNGVNLGTVWHPPFLIDITRALHPGRNNFNLIVDNTAVNGLAGSALPDYKLLTLKYGNRLEPQDMENLQPLRSGIPGKVMLISR